MTLVIGSKNEPLLVGFYLGFCPVCKDNTFGLFGIFSHEHLSVGVQVLLDTVVVGDSKGLACSGHDIEHLLDAKFGA